MVERAAFLRLVLRVCWPSRIGQPRRRVAPILAPLRKLVPRIAGTTRLTNSTLIPFATGRGGACHFQLS